MPGPFQWWARIASGPIGRSAWPIGRESAASASTTPPARYNAQTERRPSSPAHREHQQQQPQHQQRDEQRLRQDVVLVDQERRGERHGERRERPGQPAEHRSTEEVGRHDGDDAEQVLHQGEPAQVLAERPDDPGDEQRVEGSPPQRQVEAEAVRQLPADLEVRHAVTAQEERRPRQQEAPREDRHQDQAAEQDQVRVRPDGVQGAAAEPGRPRTSARPGRAVRAPAVTAAPRDDPRRAAPSGPRHHRRRKVGAKPISMTAAPISSSTSKVGPPSPMPELSAQIM